MSTWLIRDKTLVGLQNLLQISKDHGFTMVKLLGFFVVVVCFERNCFFNRKIENMNRSHSL